MGSTGRRPIRAALAAVLAAAALVPAASAVPAAAAENGRFIVQFRDGVSAQGKAALNGAGARVVVDLVPQNAVAAEIPGPALRQLAANRNIEFIEPDVARYPLAQTAPYGVPLVQADQLNTTNAGNRLISIIDSGFYTGHEDLPPNVTGGNDPGSGNWFEDTCGHGTHVAGTVSAVNNDLGVVGVNPGVNLHIVKVFDGVDCQWTFSSKLIEALNQSVEAGANVVSMSLGGSGKSRVEQKAFANAETAGALLIAAAGNSGNRQVSYPAGYPSVISVAAVDAQKSHADFSQRNKDVELAAPGVSVLSTTPWAGMHTLTAGGVTWTGGAVEGSAPTAGTTGDLVDGGLCDRPGRWAGKVVLCKRGENTFAAKVRTVEGGGAVAAVIYNNAAGGFTGTLNGTSLIPAIAISDADGAAALAHIGQPSTVVNQLVKPGSGYEAWDGTSMATPHVSGVAAAIWSCNTTWNNQQVRDALNATAEDLGTAGRDDTFGYGLVQAKAAQDYLLGPSGTCTP